MSNPLSPDSLAKEMTRLATQAEQKASELSHSQSELQAVRAKIATLNQEYTEQTERLSRKQRDRLLDEAIPLKGEILALRDGIAMLRKEEKALKDRCQEAQSSLQEATNKLADTWRAIESAQNELAEVRKQLAESTKEHDRISHMIQTNQGHISSSEQEIVRLQDDIDGRNKELKDVKNDISREIDQQKHLIGQHERDIAVLQAKKLELASFIKQSQAEYEKTRDELANRQKKLDERELNLRLREQKVEQGESKLLHNANLLNL